MKELHNDEPFAYTCTKHRAPLILTGEQKVKRKRTIWSDYDGKAIYIPEDEIRLLFKCSEGGERWVKADGKVCMQGASK